MVTDLTKTGGEDGGDVVESLKGGEELVAALVNGHDHDDGDDGDDGHDDTDGDVSGVTDTLGKWTPAPLLHPRCILMSICLRYQQLWK